MPDRPSFRDASRSTTRPKRIIEVVFDSLRRALRRLCKRRHDVEVEVRRSPDEPDEPHRITLQVECRGLVRMPVRLSATRTNDNLYEVECSLDEGPTQRFSYALSRRSGRGISPAPPLGRQLGTFVLDELEKRLGRRLLQTPASPPSAGPPGHP